MNVVIVGGGNVGTQFAAHCASKNHHVRIYTSKPEQFDKHLSVINESGDVIYEGKIALATNDTQTAFTDADLIFITMPAYCMKTLSQKIEPFVKKGMKIGLIPGTGGGECAFKKCVEKGATVFGLQRVPSVARLKERGKSVFAYGYRPSLDLAAIPHTQTNACCEVVSQLLDMKCNALPNYLNVTLTPSNPILHTTRLCTLFQDYQEGVSYEQVPLFYEEWDMASSELLLKCDREVQQLCEELKEFNLSFVKSLKIHYESDTTEQLTEKLKSINSLKGIETPTIQIGERYIPDLSSRYFTADFPYGLAILCQIADFANLAVPNMSQTLQWYKTISKNDKIFEYRDYGITNYQEFVNFYSQ